MSNLIDIQTQIEKLQKQAADIRAKEFDSTVQDIRAKMQAFGITVKDLQTVKRGSKAKGKKEATPRKRATTGAAKNAGKPVAAKFQGPNGETWSGRGLTPRWLATLVEQGRTKDEFAVKS
ncbi:H-NS histone family protein [Polaromonas sp.]|uniref:H-NS histone family protein n=1 Tax=Polaromonas sp. TaxID=1869339 RepID=UPI00286A7E77|nr:H-NS histone family protein [Polaromonas sp.]